MTPDVRAKILSAARARKISYTLIGGRFGVSRNVVAGIVFRDRYPYAMREMSPGGRSKYKAPRGHRGHGGPGRYPEQTAQGLSK